MWTLTTDSDYSEYYNLRTLQPPQNYVYSGYNYDGKVYASKAIAQGVNGDNYRWTVHTLQQDDLAGSTVVLTDKRWGKALVAGSNTDDGEVFHQDFTTESYARWGFVLVDYHPRPN